MEMDLSTALIGIISVLAFAIPIAVIYINNKKREMKSFQKLHDLAARRNCAIQDKEIFVGMSIGLDKNNTALLFINSNENQEVSQFINLNNFSKCHVNRSVQEFNVNNDKQSQITKIELHFLGKTGVKDEKIEIFDYEKKSQLFGELQFAERWCSRINSILNP